MIEIDKYVLFHRVVMRRDQVLKICMNHSLTPEINYTKKDEKTWLFAVNDFSEGELTLEQFCLRFKNKEIALEYKEAIDKALQGLSNSTDGKDSKPAKVEKDESDDVVFVSEIQATKEEKKKAKELMLPENFFTYKNKDPCQGCRGCQEDDESKSTNLTSEPSSTETVKTTAKSETKPVTSSTTTASVLKAPFITATTASTPVKGNTPQIQSPTNSVYGTPTNLEKTVDTSIFRTPLGSIGSNLKATTQNTTQNNFGNNATNKENSFTQKPSLFSSFNEDSSPNDTLQSKPVSIFGSSDTSASSKGFALAPPKLSTLNTSSENQNESTTNSFSFGSTQSKSIFGDPKPALGIGTGVSSNKSIFDFSKDKDSQNTEVKSIFGDDGKTSDNIFTSFNQGSIFGPGALTNNQSKLGGSIFGSAAAPGMSAFGSISSQNNVFGGQSIFGGATQAPAFGVAAKPEQPKTESVPEEKKAESEAEKTEPLFSVDNSLSFAALSSNSGGGFSSQSKFNLFIFCINPQPK